MTNKVNGKAVKSTVAKKKVDAVVVSEKPAAAAKVVVAKVEDKKKVVVKKEPVKKATVKKTETKKVEAKKAPVKKAATKKVAEKASKKEVPYASLTKNMKAGIAYKVKDAQKDAKQYLQDFETAETLLVMAQQENISDLQMQSDKIGSDVKAFYMHFFDFAYEILRTWQYADVDYYQNFAFAIVAQYKDMFDEFQMRIQMDCADLFILHEDENRGDQDYHYLLRENEIKDYIYYRFAHIYDVKGNLDKAKQIAFDSKHCIDDRYTYYKDIQAIIEK